MRSPAWVFWLYVGTFLPWLGCLLAYGLRSPWRSSPLGKAMFTLYASLAAVLGLAALVRLVTLPRDLLVALVVVTLAGVGIAGIVQLVAILVLQQSDRSKERQL